LKFLGRAKKFLRDLGTEPLAKVQYFNVACALGHRVRGERTEGYQALRCPACGEGVFVLPRSPLPEPAAPARSPGSRAAAIQPDHGFVEDGPVELTDPARARVELANRGPGRVEADIIWEDELAEPAVERGSAFMAPGDSPEASSSPPAVEDGRGPVARPADPATPRQGRPKPSERTAGRTPGSKAGRTATPATKPSRPGSSRRQPARSRQISEPKAPAMLELRIEPRRRSRHGWIFVLVPLIIIAAVSWRYRTQRRQDYPLIAERARDQGIPALDAGDFDKAHQLLAAGKKAVDALGGAVEGADDIREAADEAAIYVNLCDISLEDMLAEARRTIDLDTWKSKFDMVYKGRAYVFDATITAAPQDGTTGGYEIDYLVCPPGETSRFGVGGVSRPDSFAHIDLTGFELFDLARPSPGNSVRFGAQLAAFRFDNDKNYWVLQLMPKSGVFLTHPGALEALGKPATELIDPLPAEGQP
jgi:hypothetical protein